MTTPFGLWFGGSHLGFGTHMGILASAVLQSRTGPVLEYGLGFYSTPLLHLLCQEMGRELLSLEGDAEWASKFEEFRTSFHHITSMPRGPGGPDWGLSGHLPAPGGTVHTADWAVVFIDHSPDERREVDAAALANRAELVVVHDWGDAHPPCQRIAAAFKFKWVSKTGLATAVLSNVRPFKMSMGT